MPKILNEVVFSKILMMLLQGKKDKLLSKIKQDPELSKQISKVEKLAKDLKNSDAEIVKKIHAKYKGTPYEKYFNIKK